MQITHVSRQTTRTMIHNVRKCIEKFMEAYNSEKHPETYQSSEQNDMLVAMFREMIVEQHLMQRVRQEEESFGYGGEDDDHLETALYRLAKKKAQYDHSNIIKNKYEDHTFSLGTGVRRYSLASYVLRPMKQLMPTNDSISSQYSTSMKSATYAIYLLMDDGMRQVISDEFSHLERTVRNTIHQEFLKGSLFSETGRMLAVMKYMMQDYLIVHFMAAYYDTVQTMDHHAELPMEWQSPLINAQFMEVYTARRPSLYKLLYSVMKIAPLETYHAASIRRTIRGVLTDMVNYDPVAQEDYAHSAA